MYFVVFCYSNFCFLWSNNAQCSICWVHAEIVLLLNNVSIFCMITDLFVYTDKNVSYTKFADGGWFKHWIMQISRGIPMSSMHSEIFDDYSNSLINIGLLIWDNKIVNKIFNTRWW